MSNNDSVLVENSSLEREEFNSGSALLSRVQKPRWQMCGDIMLYVRTQWGQDGYQAPERGPNGPACLAVDKASSVTGPGVNVFPLLAAAPQGSQEEGGEGEEAGEGSRRGGLAGGFEPNGGIGGRLTLPVARRKV
ncbi:hypothetical protein EYF80_012926 [Liparis tanakae]|uniref:Uncharacterized protein n=1 Tax=Liparis tanakae TaxID=230148 RepID=A0A4Z2II54_9TELE|nr:hypothetical protein EYF80_012926 [Liparis tanakae]